MTKKPRKDMQQGEGAEENPAPEIIKRVNPGMMFICGHSDITASRSGMPLRVYVCPAEGSSEIYAYEFLQRAER